MSERIIKELLSQGSFFMLNKTLVKCIGLNEAAILSMLVEYSIFMKEKYNVDWFFVLAEKLQQELNLGRKPIDNAISNLVKQSLIEVQLKGIPAKRHFFIHYDAIETMIANNSDQKGSASLSKTDNQDCPNGTVYNKDISNSTNSPIIINSPITTIEEINNNKDITNKTLSQSSSFEDDATGNLVSLTDIIFYWNSMTQGVFNPIRDIKGQRLSHLSKRIKDNGLQAFYQVIDMAMQSNFLRGNNKNGWKLTFDWLINESNFTKILEGNYGNSSNSGSIEQQKRNAFNAAMSQVIKL